MEVTNKTESPKIAVLRRKLELAEEICLNKMLEVGKCIFNPQRKKRPKDQQEHVTLWSKVKLNLLPSKNRSLNILVAGAGNVGKSALLVRFLTGRFIGDYMSGDDVTYNFSSYSDHVIAFHDTSSPLEDADSQLITDMDSISNCDGIVVVYDVCDMSSFNYANSFITKLDDSFDANTKCGPKPVLLLGNKVDLKERREIAFSNVLQASLRYQCSVVVGEVSAAEDTELISQYFNNFIERVEIKKTQCGRKRTILEKRFSL